MPTLKTKATLDAIGEISRLLIDHPRVRVTTVPVPNYPGWVSAEEAGRTKGPYEVYYRSSEDRLGIYWGWMLVNFDGFIIDSFSTLLDLLSDLLGITHTIDKIEGVNDGA